MIDRNLFAQQEANRRRSFWLVTGFVLFFAWIGFGGDLAFYLATRDLPPTAYHHVIPFIGLAVTLAAGGVTWYAWTNGAKRVLSSTGAFELVEPATAQQQVFVNVVDEMAIAAGIPRPTLWIVPDPDLNAFATGRDQRTASLAVTEGLLNALSRDELQAVVAHEMGHIRNLDIKLMTLLAAMVGAVALMSDGFGRFLRYGGRIGGRGGKGGGKGNPLALVVLVLWIISLIVAPIVTRLLAMAVSRKREFLADASAAQFTRNPGALADALTRLNAAVEPTKAITRGAAHLCIVDPAPTALADREGWLANLVATHPPIQERIRRLRAMAFQDPDALSPSTSARRA